MTPIGTVAIGRNEGDRLRHCLESLAGQYQAVVYVDSGSIDGSIGLARSLGAEVVELDPSVPFTAAQQTPGTPACARSRRACPWSSSSTGIARSSRDGSIAPRRDGGRSRPERGGLRACPGADPGRSLLYNRLADIEWDTPIGEVEACGGTP